MSTPPLVSVILVNFNGRKFLNSCLSSIFANSYSHYEVIVVDNASTDGSLETISSKLTQDKRLKIIKNTQNSGPAGGFNLGVKHANGKYLAALGYDVEVDPNWLSAYVLYMETHPDVGIAQGKLMRLQAKEYFQYAGDYMGPFGFLIERANGAKDTGQYDYVADIFAINSATMCIRKDLFNHVGGFDEDYFMYLEEADLCFRVHLAGYRVVFLPSSVVYHNHSNKTKSRKDFQFYKRNYLACRNYILTLEKNFSLGNLLKILPVHISCWIILAVTLLLKGRFGHSLVIFGALGWHLIHVPVILQKRLFVQQNIRRVKDEDFKHLLTSQSLKYYLHKAFDYTKAEMPAA